MHTHEPERAPAGERRQPLPQRQERGSGPAGTAASALLALQRSAGNAAVVRAMEQERHVHGAGCGHPQEEPAVQRSADGPSVQRAADQEDSGKQPRYKQVRPSTEGTRSADLRMKDRMARTAHVPVGRRTPHVAVSDVPGDGMMFSSNSGNKKLSEARQQEALGHLESAMDPRQPLSDDPRRRKDQLKLRAAVTGQYGQVHSGDANLARTTKAMRDKKLTWDGGPSTCKKDGSVHGEMTLLGRQIAHWEKEGNHWPRGEGKFEIVAMGGVKLACGACQMAFEAANAHIGKRYGYQVAASGTHNEMFRWQAPEWLTGPAFAQVQQQAAARGWVFHGRNLEDGRSEEERQGETRKTSDQHLPEDSGSEWAESDGSQSDG
ncbi:hypothetical protein [Streptomyces pinistramenti]|uniref:hypothetical protein n=1 Tax=Streptomyces pinistramenti TaxID=2884812 RepID=UPI001D06A586|nr:hypothetical protein [Streptomyces pinistramenti]MCB5908475.1 hypothetical protein [Streptomyces pinistramenti]